MGEGCCNNSVTQIVTSEKFLNTARQSSLDHQPTNYTQRTPSKGTTEDGFSKELFRRITDNRQLFQTIRQLLQTSKQQKTAKMFRRKTLRWYNLERENSDKPRGRIGGNLEITQVFFINKIHYQRSRSNLIKILSIYLKNSIWNTLLSTSYILIMLRVFFFKINSYTLSFL